MDRSITIVGGGLAGLTLGIQLRKQEVPVTIYEAGQYPRHKVCGEFMSGRGWQALGDAGLASVVESAGGRWARTAVFYSDGKCRGIQSLPDPARCVSRFVLDELLAERFRKHGGVLCCGQRWLQPLNQPGVIQASGRPAGTTASRNGWLWYGLKAHLRGLQLSADLELHLQENGYVGLCRLQDEQVNLCGLFRRRPLDPPLPRDFKARFAQGASDALRRLLDQAVWDESSCCAVAAVPLQTSLPAAPACRIGDALVVMPPFTGNGMSLAIESASMAVTPLMEYSRGTLEWEAACASLTRASQQRFSRRLRCSRWLHGVLFQRPFRSLLAPTLRFRSVWSLLFGVTR